MFSMLLEEAEKEAEEDPIYRESSNYRYKVAHIDGVNFKRATVASFLVSGIFTIHFYHFMVENSVHTC